MGYWDKMVDPFAEDDRRILRMIEEGFRPTFDPRTEKWRHAGGGEEWRYALYDGQAQRLLGKGFVRRVLDGDRQCLELSSQGRAAIDDAPRQGTR